MIILCCHFSIGRSWQNPTATFDTRTACLSTRSNTWKIQVIALGAYSRQQICTRVYTRHRYNGCTRNPWLIQPRLRRLWTRTHLQTTKMKAHVIWQTTANEPRLVIKHKPQKQICATTSFNGEHFCTSSVFFRRRPESSSSASDPRLRFSCRSAIFSLLKFKLAFKNSRICMYCCTKTCCDCYNINTREMRHNILIQMSPTALR